MSESILVSPNPFSKPLDSNNKCSALTITVSCPYLLGGRIGGSSSVGGKYNTQFTTKNWGIGVCKVRCIKGPVPFPEGAVSSILPRYQRLIDYTSMSDVSRQYKFPVNVSRSPSNRLTQMLPEDFFKGHLGRLGVEVFLADSGTLAGSYVRRVDGDTYGG